MADSEPRTRLVSTASRILCRYARADGLTALEYALIAGLIFLAIIAGVRALGPAVSKPYQDIGTEFAK